MYETNEKGIVWLASFPVPRHLCERRHMVTFLRATEKVTPLGTRLSFEHTCCIHNRAWNNYPLTQHCWSGYLQEEQKHYEMTQLTACESSFIKKAYLGHSRYPYFRGVLHEGFHCTCKVVYPQASHPGFISGWIRCEINSGWISGHFPLHMKWNF